MRMPFGKYRGYEVDELPDDYLVWLTNIELHGRLRDAVLAEHAWRQANVGWDGPWTTPVRACRLEIAAEDVEIIRSIVDYGYRAVAKSIHPDVGGDVHAMQRLNAVTDSLRRQIGAIA